MAALSSLALLWPAAGASAEESLAAAVKATYLYKLAPFVEWPATAFGSASSPFVLCVVGHDPFGPLLDRAVAGQRVGDRTVEVHRLPTATSRSGCQIMYLGGSAEQPIADALREVKGTPTLTVTDNRGGEAAVDFVLDQGHVRFRIDDQAAADNGLTISSKLLSLAVSVTPRQAPELRR